MKNNWIIILVLVIVIIAAVLYLIGYFMRKNQEQLDELEVRKKPCLTCQSLKKSMTLKNASSWTESK